jgi:hypothetical protein
LALQISKVPMIRDFGVLLAIGIIVLVVVGIVVPASALGIREWTKPTTERGPSVVERVVVWLGGLPTSVGPVLIGLAIAVFVGEVGSEAWEVHPKVAPRPGDLLVRKTACDAFHETALSAELAARGARHLVIAGCKTEACIETTCRRAVTLGYAVTLVADGHSTTDVAAMPAPRIIAYHNQILNGFGAYVAGAPCEIVVTPGGEVQFDRAHDVPSSVQEGS